MAGSYCYYPVSTPPPAMRGYGQYVELLNIGLQIGLTAFQLQQKHIADLQAKHQAERDAQAQRDADFRAAQAAQQAAAQQAQGGMTAGAGGAIAAQLQAVPKWVWGAGAAGVAALFFLRRRVA